MATKILASVAASITDLKANPMATVREGRGASVVILNHNEPAFYCVPPKAYEAMLDRLDDLDLVEIIRARSGEKSIPVSLDDL